MLERIKSPIDRIIKTNKTDNQHIKYDGNKNDIKDISELSSDIR